MSNNPTVDNSKVLVHLQTRKSDATTQQVFMAAGNGNASSLGSNNVTVTTDTNNHPLSSYKSIVQLNYPAIADGVFRNLMGVDTTNQYISGDDDAFVIGGFYSEKHRQAMLQGFAALSADTFFLNDREMEPTYLFKIDETQASVVFDLNLTSLDDLFVDSSRLTVSDINTLLVINTQTTDADELHDIIGTNIQLGESRVMVTLDPVTQLASDYDVWSESSELSAGSLYAVGDSAYEQDVLPEIQTYLNSL